jgi:cell division protein FtsZ
VVEKITREGLMFELEEARGGQVATIKVVGVGGAGGNVVNNMIASSIRAVDFIAVNTDAQVLETSMATQKVQIGESVTRGLGAGSKPEIGREAALEDKDEIARCLEGADMVFITAGMGGGTGTGAAPVVAEIARSQGALTVAVVTKPFFYEGGRRRVNAEHGIAELQGNVDTLIVIPNDRIGLVVEKGTPLLESFAVANDVLRHAVQGVSDLIVVPGLINLDFADVRTVMRDAGRAVIGMGVGTGENRGHDAAKKAILNPLLENNSVEGASGILINITGGLHMALSDVQEATAPIYDSADKDADIIVGAVVDPDVKEEVRVTVIATGFKDMNQKVDLPSVRKWNGVKDTVSRRGSGRVLAKSLESVDDSLEVPTFLRKPLNPAAERFVPQQ